MADIPGLYPVRNMPLVNQAATPDVIPGQGSLYSNAGVPTFRSSTGTITALGGGGASGRVNLGGFFGFGTMPGGTNSRLSPIGITTGEVANRVVAYGGTITAVSVNLSQASTTFSFGILVNGVQQGVANGTGIGGGIVLGSPISFSAGDSLGIIQLSFTGGSGAVTMACDLIVTTI